MSRVGKQPISLPAKVTVKLGADRMVLVEGPKGKLDFPLPKASACIQEDKTVNVSRASEHRTVRALHGTARASSAT